MKFFLALSSVLAAAAASSVPLVPAGVDPAACPNYPRCSIIPGAVVAPVAALPTPIVNGQPIAPVLNTNLEQTAYYQQVLLILKFIIC